MNDNSLQELEKHFNAFIKVEDPDEFHSGLTSYFRFIEDTYPLRDIAQNIFSSSSGLRIFSNVSGLYQMFVYGKLKHSFSVSPLSVGGSGISIFHTHMVESLKKNGLGRNQRAITKDMDGNYYYKSEKLPFTKNKIYFYLFDYLFGLPNGEASYKDIDNYLSSKGFGVKENKHLQHERIRNALKVYNKNKRFPTAIGNTAVLEVSRGVGVRLNNPEI